MTRHPKEHRKGAQKLLIAAERLFGKHGLDQISLRQVAVAAGHANNSAVQHHFHSKQGLILAAFQMRLPVLERARQQWLDTVEQSGPAKFEDILAAILMPIVYALREPTRTTFAMFGLRLMDGDLADRTRTEQFAPIAAAIAGRLQAHLPDLPAAVFDVRYRLAVRLFLNGFIELKRMTLSHSNPYPSEEMFWDDVFQCSVAAFRADFPPASSHRVSAHVPEPPRSRGERRKAALAAPAKRKRPRSN